MSEQRNFANELRNQQIILDNLAEAGTKGQNAEAVLHAMRRLWNILMDTEFSLLDGRIQDTLRNTHGDRIGLSIAQDLRRLSVLERYFRTRGRGFFPYIGLHDSTLVFIRRRENLERIVSLHDQIKQILQLTLEGLEQQ